MNHFNKVEVWSVFDVVVPSMVRLGLNYNISLRSWIFHTLEGEEPQIKKFDHFKIFYTYASGPLSEITSLRVALD